MKFDSLLRGIQGNFDHIMGLLRNLASAHNLVVDDLETIQNVIETHTQEVGDLDTAVGSMTGGDHGTLAGLADDDHTQYVKDAGDSMTGNLAMTSSADILLGTGSTLIFESDTNLYRYAANVLKTDDDFIIKNVLLSAVTVDTTNDTLRLNGYGVMFANHNAGNTYVILDSSGTGTGSMVLQAGGGSASWGGTINLREAAHASKPGWVEVGLGVANSKFAVNDGGFGGGTEILGLTRAGQLSLPVVSSAGGLVLGGDANLYRAAADTLKTDDSLIVVGTITQNAGKTVLDTDHTAAADPHTGYLLESLFDAKGDVISASADNTPAKTTVGADGTYLKANSGATGGVSWDTPAGTGAVATDAIWDAKGDLAGGTGANTAVRVAVGSDGTFLKADSGATAGVSWDTPAGGGAVATDVIWDAKGDLAAGTGANTATKLTVGSDDTILMADASVANGLKWVASASPSAVGTAAATGTADTFTRGDHVHAHEAGHVAHDTLWDAKGDLVTGSAADTAVRTAVGTDGNFLKADSGGAGGVSWVDHTGAADPHTGYLKESVLSEANVTDLTDGGATTLHSHAGGGSSSFISMAKWGFN